MIDKIHWNIYKLNGVLMIKEITFFKPMEFAANIDLSSLFSTDSLILKQKSSFKIPLNFEERYIDGPMNVCMFDFINGYLEKGFGTELCYQLKPPIFLWM